MLVRKLELGYCGESGQGRYEMAKELGEEIQALLSAEVCPAMRYVVCCAD